MVAKLRLLPLALVALLALTLAACGGSSGDDGSGDDSSGDTAYGDSKSDAESVDYVANAQAVLAESAQSFDAQDVTALQGDVVFDFTMGTTAVTGNADFSYQAPDQMYLTLGFTGGDSQSVVDLSQFGTFEVLVRDGAAYLDIPVLGGWIALTAADMEAFGGDAVPNLVTRGSIFDYSAFMQDTDSVAFVGKEDVGGEPTLHYTVTGGLQTLIGAFADALATTGDNALSDRILGSQLDGPIAVDVWVGEDDHLPYKITAAGNITVPDGTALVMNVAATFHDYNAAVSIPPAPTDAQSFTELLGALGMAPPAAPTQ